jgi:uncharacterized protein with ParB-like and HNH nuclease domain
MDNGVKTIFQLYTGEKQFVIPKYQRAYAWEEEEQVADFLEDIKNQKGPRSYFFGTILLEDRKENKGGYERIYIVDGQQRMITISIFMKVILGILKNKGSQTDPKADRRYLKDGNVYKIELVPTDNEFFKTYIIDNDQDADTFVKTPSQKRLVSAKKYFKSMLEKFDIAILEEYKSKLENSKVLIYSVDDTAEATLIFETINDRGRPLTNLEKTKSFLMHKTYLTSANPDSMIDSIQDRFGEIYRTLEQLEKEIDEDSILQYHFISHFQWGYSQKSKDYQDYVSKVKEKVNDLMLKGQVNDLSDFIDTYSKELKESFYAVNSILGDRNSDLRDLFILERLSQFYPLVIKSYKLDNDNKKKNFYELIRLLEIFSFRVYGIGEKPPYTARDWLYTLARDFEGNFEKLKCELATKIIELEPDNHFKDRLSSVYLYQDMGSDNLDLRYLFWKYENYLRQDFQPKFSPMSETEFLADDPKYKLTIEHIASQNPRVSTPNLVLPPIDEDFQENYINRIGNLTFDPHSANASKGNKAVPEKNSKYFVRAPLKTQNELDDFIIGGNSWTRKSIDTRGEKIIRFSLDYWNPLKEISGDAIKKYYIEKEKQKDISELKRECRSIMTNMKKAFDKEYNSWEPEIKSKVSSKGFIVYQPRDSGSTQVYLTLSHKYMEFSLTFDLIHQVVMKSDESEVYHGLRIGVGPINHYLSDQKIQNLLNANGYEERKEDKEYVKIELLKVDSEAEGIMNEFNIIVPVLKEILKTN